MFMRFICLLLTLILVCSAALAEDGPVYSFDFSLGFSVDAEAFPPAYRLRMRGYSSLAERLTLQGNATWCPEYNSFDLNASVFFTDKPDTAIRFHMYGTPGRIFISSPLIANETIMLNMYAFLEFSLKTQNSLGIEMPWLAMFYPLCTERAFESLSGIWNETAGPANESVTLSKEQVEEIADRWGLAVAENVELNRWISAFSGLSSLPSLVQDEFMNLSDYFLFRVCGNDALSSGVDGDSVVWKNAAGMELFSIRSSESGSETRLSLPATINGYFPAFSLIRTHDEHTHSFELAASYQKPEPSVTAVESAAAESAEAEKMSDDTAGEEQDDPDDEDFDEEDWDDEDWDEEDWAEEEEEEAYPSQALILSLTGTDLPDTFPDDGDFSLVFSLLGALVPNYTFEILCSTKKDGSVAVSVCKPFEEYDDPVVILHCEGTAVPVTPDSVPDHRDTFWEGMYNVLSFNENKLADFREKAYRPLARGLLTFVAEAPAASIQSLLDDLTDMKIIDFILAQ